MFQSNFDPYELLMELTQRIQHLEQQNRELVRAFNANHNTVQGILKNQQNMAEAHRELTNYVTAKKSITPNTP